MDEYDWADQERLARQEVEEIERNMNELSLVINQNPGSIDINFDALEEQLDKKLSEYKGAVFTESSKAIAKAEVASLRKLKKDIEDSRKAVKKKWMEPYEQFEKKMKSLSAKVDEPINAINEQVQAFEEKRKQEKRELIRNLYEDTLADYEDCRDYISLDKLYDSKWENASVSAKSIKKDMMERMSGIQTAVSSIKAMHSDKEEDALVLYKQTLDLNRALQMISVYEQNKAEALKREEERRKQEEERRIQAEIERAKMAEREAIRREEQIRKEVREKAEEFIPVPVPDTSGDNLPFEQPTTITAYYCVVATPEELEAVETAFNSIGIYFERRDK